MSGIDIPINEKCAFCEYLSGARPYTILRRDNHTATLVTREQRGVPHLLVIPIKHVPTILELEDHQAESLMLAIREAAKAIDWAYNRQGISIWQNNGTPSHQTIAHLHFHVAGTLGEGGTKLGNVSEISIQETEHIASSLEGYFRN
ncbi:HIT family protein [Pseudomonas aeruginosa]|uniref:HIT family protein n=1 Tax=Pseudomonas aeruginosa TaxID=287 RepID=UPI0009A39875|nr:HIT family protein [Pseudomonas aeruginosa]HCF3861277.1 HIT family protein [Pseudomonas aeruginosa]HCF4110401.1 HIT family protein [Pseudomonas aeruginosa]HEJ1214050.1 HIT family protein [Pseudomonas aeruginosa]HEK3416239.1 HIT family protein [Pseudomonas aeruginosa]